MTSWVFPDANSTATPLALFAKGETDSLPSLMNMFLGVRGGCLGETCILALLLGGIYLVIRRVITWHTPVAFIGTVALMSLFCGRDVRYRLFVLARDKMGQDYRRNFLRIDYGSDSLLGQLPRGRIVLDIVNEYPHSVHRKAHPC